MNPSQTSTARRRVVQGLAALAASGVVPSGVAQSPSQLGAVSRPLTGFAYDDPQVAAAMLRAMNAAFGSSSVQRVAAIAATTPASGLMAALRGAGLDNVAQRMIVALYSGTVETPQGSVVVAYNEALGWRAVPWTKPNAICGGPTDYWASAPSDAK